MKKSYQERTRSIHDYQAFQELKIVQESAAQFENGIKPRVYVRHIR